MCVHAGDLFTIHSQYAVYGVFLWFTSDKSYYENENSSLNEAFATLHVGIRECVVVEHHTTQLMDP